MSVRLSVRIFHSWKTNQTFQPLSSQRGWLGSRVVSVLDSGAVGSGFKSQPRGCQVTVLGKLFTPIVPLFTKGKLTAGLAESNSSLPPGL